MDNEGDVTAYIWLRSIILLFGLLANVIMIYIIAAHRRFHTKTYLLILNVAISDLLMLIVCTELYQMLWEYHEEVFSSICVLFFLEEILQVNTIVFLAVLATNSLMENERVKLKWIIYVTYTIIAITSIANGFSCVHPVLKLPYVIWNFVLLFFDVVIIFKSCNSCYKSAIRKNPLRQSTMFRLDFVAIYCFNYLFVFVVMFLFEIFLRYNYVYMHTGFMYIKLVGFCSSVFLLIYLIRSDGYFCICFRSMLKCKRLSDGNEDAVMYAEEIHGASINNPRNSNLC